MTTQVIQHRHALPKVCAGLVEFGAGSGDTIP
jgi:hypothetical protein